MTNGAIGYMDVLDAVKLLRRAKRSPMAEGMAGDFEQIICELMELRRQMELNAQSAAEARIDTTSPPCG